MSNRYDVVIIGGGLGGLECGVFLSKEGYRVCVLEQAALIGGCLQSFLRNGRLIDTGIHYIGSMGEGQIMRQYLKYFGILDELPLIRLDEDFDEISLKGGEVFCYRQGYENFYTSLCDHFPAEREGLRRYCDKIKEIGDSIGVQAHVSGRISRGGLENLGYSAAEFVEECVSDPVLQSVLCGTNVLYGGVKGTSTLYHHAMINHSNIEGAYRVAGGTQRMADLLVKRIQAHGGEVYTNARVMRLEMAGARVCSAVLANSEKIEGRYFISAIHPTATFGLLDETPVIRKAFRSRLNFLPQTYSLFAAYLLMKPGSFPYLNKNYYYYHSGSVWDTVPDAPDLFPKMMMMHTQAASLDATFSEVVTLLTPINTQLFEPWSGTLPGHRGEDYTATKEQITRNLIAYAGMHCPQVLQCVEQVYSASPLTYQHYTGAPQGAAYGILKDYRNRLATLLPTRTRLENLFLTGQNLNVHGAIGVSLTAATTCAELLGTEYLAKKIGAV